MFLEKRDNNVQRSKHAYILVNIVVLSENVQLKTFFVYISILKQINFSIVWLNYVREYEHICLLYFLTNSSCMFLYQDDLNFIHVGKNCLFVLTDKTFVQIKY